jgi:hypothetical protein
MGLKPQEAKIYKITNYCEVLVKAAGLTLISVVEIWKPHPKCF